MDVAFLFAGDFVYCFHCYLLASSCLLVSLRLKMDIELALEFDELMMNIDVLDLL